MYSYGLFATRKLQLWLKVVLVWNHYDSIAYDEFQRSMLAIKLFELVLIIFNFFHLPIRLHEIVLFCFKLELFLHFTRLLLASIIILKNHFVHLGLVLLLANGLNRHIDEFPRFLALSAGLHLSPPQHDILESCLSCTN